MTRIRRVVMPKNTQTKLLKEKTRKGKPCGDDYFYDKIKKFEKEKK